MDKLNFETIFFFLFFIGIIVLSFFIFLPYIGALVIALTLTIIFRPAYKKLLKILRNKNTLAALLTILVIVILVLIPIVFFSSQIFQEARELYISFANNKTSDFLSKTIITFENYIPAPFNAFSIDAHSYIKQGLEWVVQNLSSFFSGFLQFIISFFLTFLALFYLLKDGDKLKENILKLSPLSGENTKKIIEKIKNAINSVVKGVLVIALVQGILTGIGFKIFGIPNPALWGSLAMFSALIPSIGTSIVIIPGILFLFFTSKIFGAVGLTIWGFVAVGLIDNFLAPILIERGIKIHSFLILLSVLGGLSVFGVIGFLLGPIILSLLFAFFDIYLNLTKIPEKT